MTRELELSNLSIQLKKIADAGWIENRRSGNDGGVGNTLEDLLEVTENNYSLPDIGEWEIKAQRSTTTSLLTLVHNEPEPRIARLVPRLLLPYYGWQHAEAGKLYPETERSFRQTLYGLKASGRGFYLVINYVTERVEVHFDASKVDTSMHSEWLADVESKVGLGDLDPIPYWTFELLEEKLTNKLNNMLYFRAKTKRVEGTEFYNYEGFHALVDPTLENFLKLLEEGVVAFDFDARTGHNHGTKIRMRRESVRDLYSNQIDID